METPACSYPWVWSALIGWFVVGNHMTKLSTNQSSEYMYFSDHLWQCFDLIQGSQSHLSHYQPNPWTEASPKNRLTLQYTVDHTWEVVSFGFSTLWLLKPYFTWQMKCLSLSRTDWDILLCFHLCQTWSREHRWHWVTCWTLFYDRRVSDHCQCWDNYWLLTFFLIMIQSSEQMILSTSPWCHCLINITLMILWCLSCSLSLPAHKSHTILFSL